MTNGSLASNRIVDLLRYKAERRQQKLDFNSEASAQAAVPSLATITPFRPLTEEAVKHRERMLGHLAALTTFAKAMVVRRSFTRRRKGRPTSAM